MRRVWSLPKKTKMTNANKDIIYIQILIRLCSAVFDGIIHHILTEYSGTFTWYPG